MRNSKQRRPSCWLGCSPPPDHSTVRGLEHAGASEIGLPAIHSVPRIGTHITPSYLEGRGLQLTQMKFRTCAAPQELSGPGPPCGLSNVAMRSIMEGLWASWDPPHRSTGCRRLRNSDRRGLETGKPSNVDQDRSQGGGYERQRGPPNHGSTTQ
jgi:hypothetical protein